MKVTAFLVTANTIKVLPYGEPKPDEYMAVMDVDTGVGTDWRFAVEFAKARMRETYKAVTATRVAMIEVHSCKAKTVMVKGKRYDLSGGRHSCKDHRRKKVLPEKGLFDE